MDEHQKVLMLVDLLADTWSSNNDEEMQKEIDELKAAILTMIDQHEGALVKAAGEWVDIISEAQIDDDDECWYQLDDGSTCRGCGNWLAKIHGKKLVRMWEPRYEPPAPPPIPKTRKA